MTRDVARTSPTPGVVRGLFSRVQQPPPYSGFAYYTLERFVKGPPHTNLPPEQLSINPITPDEAGTLESLAVNFPTLTAAQERKIR